ncbi:MAG: hypothetical protein QME81_09020 [bacterium]|nr:hypothetical protein [bacterium]
MNEIEYELFLSSDMKDRLRVRALKDKGEILQFVVQYEAFIETLWHPIVRYDTAHGFAHIDVMFPDGRIDKQPIYSPSYSLAFTYATQDLRGHWREYRRRYERRMKI